MQVVRVVVNVVCHALRRWERAAALVCVGALLAVAVSCAGTLLRPQLTFGGLWSPSAGGGGNQSAAAPADWRLLFCPPMRTPWSFDYLELTWLRAAFLVNASSFAGAEGPPRKLLQPGAAQQFVNASAHLTPVQLAAVQRYARWSPGSMPWRDAGAIYVRLYKSGNDAFKGELDAQRFAWSGTALTYSPSLVSHVATQQTSRPSTTTAHLILWMRQR